MIAEIILTKSCLGRDEENATGKGKKPKQKRVPEGPLMHWSHLQRQNRKEGSLLSPTVKGGCEKYSRVRCAFHQRSEMKLQKGKNDAAVFPLRIVNDKLLSKIKRRYVSSCLVPQKLKPGICTMEIPYNWNDNYMLHTWKSRHFLCGLFYQYTTSAAHGGTRFYTAVLDNNNRNVFFRSFLMKRPGLLMHHNCIQVWNNNLNPIIRQKFPFIEPAALIANTACTWHVRSQGIRLCWLLQ